MTERGIYKENFISKNTMLITDPIRGDCKKKKKKPNAFNMHLTTEKCSLNLETQNCCLLIHSIRGGTEVSFFFLHLFESTSMLF